MLTIEGALYAMAFAVAKQPFGSTPQVKTQNIAVAIADNFKSFVFTIHTSCHIFVCGQMVPLTKISYSTHSRIIIWSITHNCHKLSNYLYGVCF